MPYKTISVKLFKPTARKKQFLDDAIERYSLAFEILLRDLKDRLPDEKLSKNNIMKLVDKEALEKVNFLNIEPFKDAIKLDLAKVISIYQGKLQSNQKTSFPITRTDKDDLNRLFSEAFSKKQLNSAFDKYKKCRPLLFCRFDEKRDYSVLNDSGKYYAKLYIFNRKTAVDRQRFLILPLNVAPWQERHLKDIENENASAKSAELISRNGCYFLNIRLWYDAPEPFKPATYIGIARGVVHDLCYSIADGKTSAVTSQGIITADKTLHGRNRLHDLANQVIRLAKENQSQIILENFSTRNDGLKQDKFPVTLGIGDYNLLSDIITYKAELSAVPKPISVSAGAIFFRCPHCKIFKKANRFGRSKFICINCGFSGELEDIGSENLAKALLTYQKNAVPVHYFCENGNITFQIHAINFSYTCVENINSMTSFRYELRKFLAAHMDEFNRNQCNIASKLLSDDSGSKMNMIEL